MFPRVRASIWKSYTKKVEETAARAQFEICDKGSKDRTVWTAEEGVGKMVRDCSDSSV
jgi:hypothetical protein